MQAHRNDGLNFHLIVFELLSSRGLDQWARAEPSCQVLMDGMELDTKALAHPLASQAVQCHDLLPELI